MSQHQTDRLYPEEHLVQERSRRPPWLGSAIGGSSIERALLPNHRQSPDVGAEPNTIDASDKPVKFAVDECTDGIDKYADDEVDGCVGEKVATARYHA